MDSDKYTVLIVDDEEIITESINTLLTLETDYNILIFYSPSKALERIQTQEIDLVISDYLMPGEMNGVDFLLRVRSEEHTSELQSHSFISYAVFCLKKKNSRCIEEI